MNTRMMRSSSFSMPAHDAMWAPEWRQCECLGFRHENEERCLISVHGYWDVFSTFRASSTFPLTRPHDVSKPCISSIATIILQITRFMVLFSCRGGFWPLSPAVTIPMDSLPPPLFSSYFVHLHHFLSGRGKKKKFFSAFCLLNTPASDSGASWHHFWAEQIKFHFSFEHVCHQQPTGGISRQLYMYLHSQTLLWSPTQSPGRCCGKTAANQSSKNKHLFNSTYWLGVPGEQRVNLKINSFKT